jgi:hypothetical protein
MSAADAAADRPVPRAASRAKAVPATAYISWSSGWTDGVFSVNWREGVAR